MFKKLSIVMLVIALAFMLGACASTEYVKDIAEIAPATPTIAPPEATPAAKVVEVSKVAVIKAKVLFDFDSFELDTVARLVLEKIAIEMGDAPETLLILKGHTDKVGSNEYNQILSEDRADAVEDYLVQAGIPSERIVSVKGFGKTLLLPEMTDHENRRVIILSVE